SGQQDGARGEGDEQETCLRERRVDPGRGEVLDDFDRATALDRHDPNGKPRVLCVGCGKERAALAAGDVLYLLKDEPGVWCFEVGSEDCAGGGDYLGVHVRPSRHQLRWRTETAPAVPRAWAPAGCVLRRGLQVPLVPARQRDEAVAAAAFHSVAIERDVHEAEHAARFRAVVAATPKGSDAREQLVESERFDEIIVGAGVETFDAIADGGARREHEYGHL